ncbi:hypothetical protein AMELA_G00083890 [Ameiurus melas]|uniref:PB1 domain-containing protein n=1 Tax=Ameiurus melas TaxID=219545 RepID=A0A7J6B0R0_AMEME|nr:hypothetical protein AMELA_G00083890 [Ameiurus melas]
MIRSLGKSSAWRCRSVVEVKSKFGAEFRRFSLDRYEPGVFKDFCQFILKLHHLFPTEIYISYADVHGDLLPINNDDNFCKAVSTAQTLLRIFIQLQEEMDQVNICTNCVTRRKKSPIMVHADVSHRGHVQIGLPKNFRPVSSIIDVDILPECHRRVRLYHQGSDRPLGFYIRDGITFSVTPHGLVKVVEILDHWYRGMIGKPLKDQVTDMMIANSRNLIITVKPANQSEHIKSPTISPNPELQFDGKGSISYPGLPMIMGAYVRTHNDSVSDDDSDMVVEKPVKPSAHFSSTTVSSPSFQASIHNCHRNSRPYSQESCCSQLYLNYTAHPGFSTSLQREISSQQLYMSNPAFRQSTSSTFDILGSLSPALRQRLMIPEGSMEEDGVVITL